MAKLLWVVAVLAALVAVAGAVKSGESPAPAPGAHCSVLVYDVIDCITYIGVGGSDEKPSKSCCSGFKKVVKADSDCVCEALKSCGRLGIDFNMSRVMALPSACGASSSFSLSTCDIFAAPDSAPAPAPVPVTPAAPTPAPATVPVPSPGPDMSPSPDIVWPPPPVAVAPVVEPPAVSPESGTHSATVANPRLLVFCMVALAAAIFYYV